MRHLDPDLGPARLRLVAALNGIAPPPAEDFDYCEIGSAHGDTLASLAASNPSSRFVGVDLSDEHVASARRLARDAGLENLGYLAGDFEDVEDLETFDYIAAHGVLSWIGEAKRRALMELAGKRLKPGGLLYVSYNAMPGWAAVEPLRQLLLSPPSPPSAPGDAAGGSSLERAKRGLDFARALANAGAGYFADNPKTLEMLDVMEKHGLPYVVHEYLHESWSPMYFARVAWELAQYGLRFAGLLPAYLNFRDTALSEALAEVLAPAADRATFESLRDFALNEFFRRDVYVKSDARPDPAVTRAYLDATPWGTLSANPSREPAKLPQRTLAFDGPLYDALLDELAAGAKTPPSLAARPSLRAFGLDAVRDAVRRLAVAGRVAPMLQETRMTPVSGRLRVASAYNDLMLRKVSADVPLAIASPVCGAAFPIPPEGVVALRRALGGNAAAGMDDTLAKLVELGVLEPVPRA